MMGRTLLAVMVLVFGGTAFAAGEGKDVKITGYVIDNMCASASQNDLAEKAKGHPTACATMPNCMKSGYSVVADGKQYKLDEDGNKKVIALLKGGKSKKGLAVEVEGTLEGDMLKVKKIALVEG